MKNTALLLLSFLITAFSNNVFAFELTSPSFQNNQLIPTKFTCNGENISPELNWRNVPENTKSLALIVDDPSASKGVWTHWVVYNIPANTNMLKENVEKFTDGTMNGQNSYSNEKFDGPCPPTGTHRYFFTLYALDTILDLPKPVTSKILQSAMQNHILAKASFIGLYGQNK